MHEHSKVILGANNFPPQHQYNDADYFAASSIFGDEARRPYPSKCHKWSNESSVEDSTFTYSFPTNSSVLHFTSRGHFVGTVDYVLAKSSASGKFINVSVTLGATGSYTGGSSKHDKHSYWVKLRPSWWPCKRRHPKKPRAKVCLLNEPGSQDPSGFAILVSRGSFTLRREPSLIFPFIRRRRVARVVVGAGSAVTILRGFLIHQSPLPGNRAILIPFRHLMRLFLVLPIPTLQKSHPSGISHTPSTISTRMSISTTIPILIPTARTIIVTVRSIKAAKSMNVQSQSCTQG